MALREMLIDEVVARRRGVVADARVRERVAGIIERVRDGGSDALRDIAKELGDPEPRMLDREAMRVLARGVGSETRALLDRSVARVRRVAEAQVPGPIEPVTQQGARTGFRFVPVDGAACYAPAGRHPLASSAIMGVVPAKAAGVRMCVVVTPGDSPVMAAAALSAGADAMLVAGGAQAIAACALGAAPAVRTDVVVGPGNAYVAEAKRQLVGVIGIDGVAGPSEVLVVADADSDPRLVAADLLAQAEHDTDAEAVLLLRAGADAGVFVRAVEAMLAGLATRETALVSLERRGAVVRWSSLEEAAGLIDALAPEHLALHLRIDEARALAALVRHAGAVFVGEGAGEVLGDYAAGPNHTLPTGGCARFQQGLSPSVFLRMRAELEVVEPDAALMADVAVLARLEGLAGHEMAARLRMR